MKKDYSYQLNTAHYGTHQIASRLMRGSETVLDVGCSEGYLALLNPDIDFYGIDQNITALSIAKKRYKKVWKLDLNEGEIPEKMQFECILFLDILEHLLFPKKVLLHFLKYLRKDGVVVISLPNVANIAIRLSLLLGRFDYTDAGILDKTHLHLYTLKTAQQLIQDAGLKIITVQFSSNHFGFLFEYFPWLGTLLGFNIILKCKKM